MGWRWCYPRHIRDRTGCLRQSSTRPLTANPHDSRRKRRVLNAKRTSSTTPGPELITEPLIIDDSTRYGIVDSSVLELTDSQITDETLHSTASTAMLLENHKETQGTTETRSGLFERILGKMEGLKRRISHHLRLQKDKASAIGPQHRVNLTQSPQRSM